MDTMFSIHNIGKCRVLGPSLKEVQSVILNDRGHGTCYYLLKSLWLLSYRGMLLFRLHQNSLEGLLKHPIAGPYPRVSDKIAVR